MVRLERIRHAMEDSGNSSKKRMQKNHVFFEILFCFGGNRIRAVFLEIYTILNNGFSAYPFEYGDREEIEMLPKKNA